MNRLLVRAAVAVLAAPLVAVLPAAPARAADPYCYGSVFTGWVCHPITAEAGLLGAETYLHTETVCAGLCRDVVLHLVRPTPASFAVCASYAERGDGHRSFCVVDETTLPLVRDTWTGTVDPPACTVLAAFAGGYGYVSISAYGDVTAGGARLYDCPPYGSWPAPPYDMWPLP